VYAEAAFWLWAVGTVDESIPFLDKTDGYVA
jgi:hypothetical protein